MEITPMNFTFSAYRAASFSLPGITHSFFRPEAGARSGSAPDRLASRDHDAALR